MNQNGKSAGFALVELAIALVIIAILTGVVMTGAYIRDSNKASIIISEASYYKEATTNFKTKYSYIPGDVPDPILSNNFHDYAKINCGSEIFGDGVLNGVNGEDLFFIQLSQAKFIRQNIYFHPCDILLKYRKPGPNRPFSNYSDRSGWRFYEFDRTEFREDSYVFEDIFRLGGIKNNADSLMMGETVRVSDAVAIDAKIDMPNTPLTGRFIVSNGCIKFPAGVYKNEDSEDKCYVNFAETYKKLEE